MDSSLNKINMAIQSNTERFMALKKLSEMKMEYHKNNLMENIPFAKTDKKKVNKFKASIGVIQSIVVFFKTLNKQKNSR